MIKPKLILSFFGFVLLVFGVAASYPANIAPKETHCYSLLSPADGTGIKTSQILKTECFDSFSKSMRAATRGRVQLDAAVQPEDLTEAQLNPVEVEKSANAQVVIGVDWDYANYAGSTYIWVVTTNGCSDSVFYSVSSMPAGWNDRVSSAKAYSNCNYFYHYQDSNFGEPSTVCNTECATMGSLDNATSSEKWLKNP
jgi:hypothetical protein